MSRIDKWNASNRLLRQAESLPYPAEVVTGILPGVNCSNKQFRKTSVLESSANTERIAEGDEFVWRPRLEGL